MTTCSTTPSSLYISSIDPPLSATSRQSTIITLNKTAPQRPEIQNNPSRLATLQSFFLSSTQAWPSDVSMPPTMPPTSVSPTFTAPRTPPHLLPTNVAINILQSRNNY